MVGTLGAYEEGYTFSRQHSRQTSPTKGTNRIMNSSALKKELKQRGILQVEIAQHLGKSPAAVSLVVSGKSRSKLIEEHIAKILGHERLDIWKPTRSVESDASDNAEHGIYQRLLSVVDSSLTSHLEELSGDADVFSLEDLFNGHRSATSKPFMVSVSSHDDCDAEQRVNRWLDTPNPMFADRCPRLYLTGSDDERSFLEKVIASIEQGSFS